MALFIHSQTSMDKQFRPTLYRVCDYLFMLGLKLMHVSKGLPAVRVVIKFMFCIYIAWISNFIHYRVWDEVTYPFPNFNGATIEVWEWISNFTPHFTGYVITYIANHAWTKFEQIHVLYLYAIEACRIVSSFIEPLTIITATISCIFVQLVREFEYL